MGSGNRSTILIVDDEAQIIAMVEDMLAEYNYVLITARNALEALDCMNRSVVDLLLTDINMPDIDGFELVARTRQAFPTMKCAYMTGGNITRLPSSDDQILNKPYNVRGLVGFIDKVLGFEAL